VTVPAGKVIAAGWISGKREMESQSLKDAPLMPVSALYPMSVPDPAGCTNGVGLCDGFPMRIAVLRRSARRHMDDLLMLAKNGEVPYVVE
jgi:hypothetical protein